MKGAGVSVEYVGDRVGVADQGTADPKQLGEKAKEEKKSKNTIELLGLFDKNLIIIVCQYYYYSFVEKNIYLFTYCISIVVDDQ